MIALLVVYMVGSVAVGFWGRDTALGFVGTFIFSLVLTPFITGLFLLAFRPGKQSRDLLLRAQLDAHDNDK